MTNRGWVVLGTLLGVLNGSTSLRAEVGGAYDEERGAMSLNDVLSGRWTTAFVPEYDRRLDRVLLSIHGFGEKEWLKTNLDALSRMPSYTQVLLLVPRWTRKPELEYLHRRLAARPRSALRLDEDRIAQGYLPEMWAQDLGEETADGFFLGRKGRASLPGLAALGIRAHKHVLPLDGGNVQLARNRNGRRIVFVGSEEFEGAVGRVREVGGKGHPASLARTAYRMTFDADEVIVLPNLPSAHIDQAVLFLKDGVVATEALPEPTDEERHLLVNFLVEWVNASSTGPAERIKLFAKDYLGQTRRVTSGGAQRPRSEVIPTLYMSAEQQEIFLRYRAECPQLYDLVFSDERRRNRVWIERRLVSAGFDVIRLRTSVWHDYNCQNYVNAMPFRNRLTGRSSVMLPVYRYPGAVGENVDANGLRGLNLENVEILKAHGFEVIPVPSHIRKGGNLHCSIYQF